LVKSMPQSKPVAPSEECAFCLCVPQIQSPHNQADGQLWSSISFKTSWRERYSVLPDQDNRHK